MQTTPLSERAQGRWVGILPHLGVPAGFLTGRHQPCPLCGGRDRARFDDKDGRGTWICSHCGAGDGVRLVMALNGWDFRTAAERIEALLPSSDPAPPKQKTDAESQRRALRELWGSSTPIGLDDPAGRYLHARVGTIVVPPSLRYVPRCRYAADEPGGGATYHPAMVAMVSGPDGRAVTIHRTYLTADGEKAKVASPRRLMPGELAKGSAVRLGVPIDGMLGIAEGIETALSAMVMFGVPCWAALNARMMQQWEPPADVSRVVIFADHDANFTGQAAAYALAHRLAVKDRSVEVRLPDLGTDWNDVLTGRRHGIGSEAA